MEVLGKTYEPAMMSFWVFWTRRLQRLPPEGLEKAIQNKTAMSLNLGGHLKTYSDTLSISFSHETHLTPKPSVAQGAGGWDKPLSFISFHFQVRFA